MPEQPRPPFIRYADGSTHEGTVVPARADVVAALDDRDLTFIRIDHQTRLRFDDSEVVIECPFVLDLPHDGGSHELDAGDWGTLGPMLQLYPGRLIAATIDDAATLRLAFADGSTVTVPPNDRYEAWQVNGPGSFLVVCVPGRLGHLAIWT